MKTLRDLVHNYFSIYEMDTRPVFFSEGLDNKNLLYVFTISFHLCCFSRCLIEIKGVSNYSILNTRVNTINARNSTNNKMITRHTIQIESMKIKQNYPPYNNNQNLYYTHPRMLPKPIRISDTQYDEKKKDNLKM